MFPDTTAMNIFVLPNLNLQKASPSPCPGNEDQCFQEVPDAEWLIHLLRKGHNTQLSNLKDHWTKVAFVDGIHHMLN